MFLAYISPPENLPSSFEAFGWVVLMSESKSIISRIKHVKIHLLLRQCCLWLMWILSLKHPCKLVSPLTELILKGYRFNSIVRSSKIILLMLNLEMTLKFHNGKVIPYPDICLTCCFISSSNLKLCHGLSNILAFLSLDGTKFAKICNVAVKYLIPPFNFEFNAHKNLQTFVVLRNRIHICP